MTSPVQNQKNNGTDPYKEYGYGSDTGYDSGFGDENYDNYGDPFSDPYADGYSSDGASEPQGPMTLKDVEDYVGYLKDLLSNSSLDDETKKGLEKEIKKLESQAGSAEWLKGDAKEQTLQKIQQKLSDIENKINTAGEEGADGSSGDGSIKGQIDDARTKAKDYLDKGMINQSTYDDIIKDLDKAQGFADLGSSDLETEQAQNFIESAMQKLVSGGTSDPAAQALAKQLSVSVDDVTQAATDAGVDLSAQPIKADDKLMKMLTTLGVPSGEDMSSLTQLQEQYKSKVAEWNAKADSATNTWKGDSEAVPDVQIWNELYKLYAHTDSFSSQIKQLKTKMGNDLVGALGSLGITATAGSEAGRISVNGTEMDFINEDTGTYKLDTVMNKYTDPSFSPAPRNTEAGDYTSGEAGSFWTAVGHTDGDPGGDGYPVSDFCSG